MVKKVLVDTPVEPYTSEDIEGLSVSDVYTEHAVLLERYYVMEQEVDSLRSLLGHIVEANDQEDENDLQEAISRARQHLEEFDYEDYE